MVEDTWGFFVWHTRSSSNFDSMGRVVGKLIRVGHAISISSLPGTTIGNAFKKVVLTPQQITTIGVSSITHIN